MSDVTLNQSDQSRLYIEENGAYESLPGRIRYDDLVLADETLKKFFRVMSALLQAEKDWIEEIPKDIDPLTMRVEYLKKMLASFNFKYVENLPVLNNRYLLDQAVPIFRGKAKLEFIAALLSGFFSVIVTVWEGNQYRWLWNYDYDFAFTTSSDVALIIPQGLSDHSHNIMLSPTQIEQLTLGVVPYIQIDSEVWVTDGHKHSVKIMHRSGALEFEVEVLDNHSQESYMHTTNSLWSFTSELTQIYDSPEWFDGDMHWSDGDLDVSIFFSYLGPRLDDTLIESTEELVSKLVPFRAHVYLGQEKSNYTGSSYFSPQYKYRHGDTAPIIYPDKDENLPAILPSAVFTLRPGYIPNIYDVNDVIDVEGIQTIGNAYVNGEFSYYEDVRGPFRRMISYSQSTIFGMSFTADYGINFTMSLWFSMDTLPGGEEVFLIVGQPSNKMFEFSISPAVDDRFDIKCILFYADETSQQITIARLKRDQLTNLVVTTEGSSSVDFYVEKALEQSVPLTKLLNTVGGFHSVCPSGSSFLIATLQFAECYLTLFDVQTKYDAEIIKARPYNICNLSHDIVNRELWTRLITFDYYSDRPDATVITEINKDQQAVESGVEYRYENGFYALDISFIATIETMINKIRFTIPDRPTVYGEGDNVFGGERGEFVEAHIGGLLKIPHPIDDFPTFGDEVTIQSNLTEIKSYVPGRTLPITTLSRDAQFSYLRLGNYSGTHNIGQNQLAVTIIATGREKFLLPVAPQYDGGDGQDISEIRVVDYMSPFMYALTFNESGKGIAQSTWLWDKDGLVSGEQQGPIWYDKVYWSAGAIPLQPTYTDIDIELRDYPWSINIWLQISSLDYELLDGGKYDVFGKWGIVTEQKSYRMYIINGDIVFELSLVGRADEFIVIPKAQYNPDGYFKLTYACDGEYISAYKNAGLIDYVAYDGKTNINPAVPISFGIGEEKPFSGRIGMFQMLGYYQTAAEMVEAYDNENSLREV